VENLRILRLLALILLEMMRDSTLTQKAVRLHSVGFASKEIAQFLGTSPQVINQILYVARTVGRRSVRTKKTGKRGKTARAEMKASAHSSQTR
jgi:hypothetical protein